MSRYRRGPGAEAGFSLLEVLVAFAILALSLGVLLQIFSRASVTTTLSSQYSRAASLASARLDAVGSAIPLEPGAVSGDPEDGIAWELSILPVELEPESAGAAFGFESPVTAYQVIVTTLWQDGPRVRRFSLATLRLGERLD